MLKTIQPFTIPLKLPSQTFEPDLIHMLHSLRKSNLKISKNILGKAEIALYAAAKNPLTMLSQKIFKIIAHKTFVLGCNGKNN